MHLRAKQLVALLLPLMHVVYAQPLGMALDWFQKVAAQPAPG